MKVTLNSIVPLDRRGKVERVVKKYADKADIDWDASPSSKVVLGVDVGNESREECFSGSIFQSPMTGGKAVAAVTDFLEERIWISLSASDH